MTGRLPTLETARLRLRPMRPDDVEPLLAVLGDPEAMRFYPAPFSRTMVETWIERTRERYERDGFGLLTVEDRASGAVIGDCGPSVQVVEGRSEVELGWHIRRDLWGRGYATEAATAARDWAAAALAADRLIALVDRANLASCRVAEKIGMTVDREVDWHDRRVLMYAMATRARSADRLLRERA